MCMASPRRAPRPGDGGAVRDSTARPRAVADRRSLLLAGRSMGRARHRSHRIEPRGHRGHEGRARGDVHQHPRGLHAVGQRSGTRCRRRRRPWPSTRCWSPLPRRIGSPRNGTGPCCADKRGRGSVATNPAAAGSAVAPCQTSRAVGTERHAHPSGLAGGLHPGQQPGEGIGQHAARWVVTDREVRGLEGRQGTQRQHRAHGGAHGLRRRGSRSDTMGPMITSRFAEPIMRASRPASGRAARGAAAAVGRRTPPVAALGQRFAPAARSTASRARRRSSSAGVARGLRGPRGQGARPHRARARSRGQFRLETEPARWRSSPVATIAARVRAQAPRWVGQDVELVGVFLRDRAVEDAGAERPFLLRFWQYAAPQPGRPPPSRDVPRLSLEQLVYSARQVRRQDREGGRPVPRQQPARRPAARHAPGRPRTGC